MPLLRRARTPLLVFLALTALVACGDDTGGASGDGGSSSTTATSTTASADAAATGAGGDEASGTAGQGGDPAGAGGHTTTSGQGGDGGTAEGGGGAGQGGHGGDGHGGDGQGGDGGAANTTGQGGASSLPACDAYRTTYLEVAEALDCSNAQVASPSYCDQFVDDPCLDERTAYWECAELLFSAQACTCLEYQGQMLLRCGDICAAETDALTGCSIGG